MIGMETSKRHQQFEKLMEKIFSIWVQGIWDYTIINIQITGN